MTIRLGKYFNLSGTGHTAKYGFRIEMTKLGASALSINVKSTNCEIDHVEVAGFRLSGGRYSIGSSGIVAKTDPVYCDPSTWRPNFTMYDVKIHDNYIHNVTNEGMYIGHTSWSAGTTGVCGTDTAKIKAYPHAIMGLQIYNNKVDSTGWDGFQYACSPDAQVHHNIVTHAGLSLTAGQDNGIQIGGGAGGNMYSNTIDRVSGTGINAIDFIGGTKVYNNLVSRTGKPGIYTRNGPATQTAPLPRLPFLIANNTFDSTGYSGFDPLELVDVADSIYVINNAIVGLAASRLYINVTAGAIFTEGNNYKVATRPSNLFVNPLIGDYRAKSGAPIINQGQSITRWNIIKDRWDGTRVLNSIVDIGALEYGNTYSGGIPPQLRVAAAAYPLDRAANSGSVLLYPNPTVDHVTLRSNDSDVIQSVMVSNQLGTSVIQQKNKEEYAEMELDFSQLPTGLYILHVEYKSGLISQRKVIKR